MQRRLLLRVKVSKAHGFNRLFALYRILNCCGKIVHFFIFDRIALLRVILLFDAGLACIVISVDVLTSSGCVVVGL